MEKLSEEVGCYQDDRFDSAFENRVAQFSKQSSSPESRVGACAYLAKKFNAKYFGLKGGYQTECRLSNSDAFKSKEKSTDCKVGVGASSAISVYKV